MDTLPFAPSENPFVIEHGGFYRRWLKAPVVLVEVEPDRPTSCILRTGR